MCSSPRVLHPELSGTDLILARKLPYHVGFTAIATRHEPNEPFGMGYATDSPPVLGDYETLSQLDYCLLNPSIGGKTLHDETKALKITAVIRPSCNRGAQVVVVNDDMVAKIYDPLFYNSSDDYDGGDVVFTANSDYCREAAAYRELQKSPAAQELIPAFYGTWTIDIDTLKREGDQLCKYTRQVPVILIEHVQGVTMTDIDPKVFTESIRTSVLKKVVHIDSVIFQAGVSHGDIHPRNIIVVGMQSDVEHGAPQEAIVKLIDFNVAQVRLHPKCCDVDIQRLVEKDMQAWYPRLPSPFLRFHNRTYEFAQRGWCPMDDFELMDRKSALWLWTHFKDDERYIPVAWDPNHPRESPSYVKLTHKANKSSDSGVEADVKSPKCVKSTRKANNGSDSGIEDDVKSLSVQSTHKGNNGSDSGIEADVKSPKCVTRTRKQSAQKANNSSNSGVKVGAKETKKRKRIERVEVFD
ncbi:hypothetical protein L13192_02959 [Pyrenophora tritici-repentis]|nr:hypothetical protein L13192_02959 [Pyrenophora tritici-repentis]